MYLKTQLIITGTIICLIIIAAIAAPIISPYKYDEADFSKTLQSPSLEHIMGTDQEGRDMLSRVIHGARVSIAVALGTFVLYLSYLSHEQPTQQQAAA